MRFPLHRHNRSSNGDSISLVSLSPGAPRLEIVPPAPPEEALPPASVADVASPPPAALPLPPALPFSLPLKGQFTGADSRSDRLVRQIRGEVEELRHSLDQLSLENADLMEVDIAAVVADPEAAVALPPAALVRAIVAASQRAEGLASQLASEKKKASRLRAQLREHRLLDAEARARVETLGEVIAALHGNLEDLRTERQFARGLLATSAPRELRRATPSDRSVLGECE